jgi:hypothetical protein
MVGLVGVTLMDVSTGIITGVLTVIVVVPLIVPDVAVMTDVPGATAVNNPAGLIVPVAGVVDVQVKVG